MVFTDQKSRIATEEHVNAPWNGNKKNFRCYLCGYRFKVGDYWRWVFGKGLTRNFMVCKSCDGEDVLERFKKACEELKTRFWWALER